MSTPVERPFLAASDRESDALNVTSDALESAEQFIDQQFGTGYAERHPVLVSGCLQTFAMLYLADVLRGHSTTTNGGPHG